MKAKWEITSLYKKKRTVLKAVILGTILVTRDTAEAGRVGIICSSGETESLDSHEKARWFCRDAEENEEGPIAYKLLQEDLRCSS